MKILGLGSQSLRQSSYPTIVGFGQFSHQCLWVLHLIWVNYNNLITTSPKMMVSKGNHPLLWRQFRLVKYYNFPRFSYSLIIQVQVVIASNWFCFTIMCHLSRLPGAPAKRQRHLTPGSALAHEMLWDVARGDTWPFRNGSYFESFDGPFFICTWW